jgi:glucokinase
MEVGKQAGELVAGIDLGGTKIAIGLIDGEGKVLARAEVPTMPEAGAAAAERRIVEALGGLIATARVEIAGIGIGSTGPIDPLTGEMGDVNTLPGWQGWNLVRALEARFGVKAAMENDADAAALGEARWGAGRGLKSLICVTFGTGVGGGILLDGRVYRGAGGSHPELGHFVIDPKGPECSCGARGCWEAVACGPAMEERYRALSGETLDGAAICERARKGEPVAVETVKQQAEWMALGLADMVSIFMPEALVLGGSLMRSAELFLPEIRRAIAANCKVVPHELCRVEVATLGPGVGLLGAAEVWWRRVGNARTEEQG